MKTFASLAILPLLAAAAMPATAATEAFDGCAGFVDALPAVIAKQGTWCLRADLATAIASGNAITIGAHNVTLDCNGYVLSGTAAKATATTVGVAASNRLNAAVRNCRIRGFHTGVALAGAGAAVLDSELQVMTSAAILIDASPGRVRGNRISWIGVDAGPAPLGRGIQATGEVDIVGNDVSWIVGRRPGRIVGILSQNALSNVVAGNRLSRLHNEGGGATVAVQVGSGTSLSRTVVHDNVVSSQSGSVVGSFGVLCGGRTVLVAGNQVSGWSTGLSPGCVDRDNVVLP